jgi:outer membrane protein assembly factor BamD
VLRITRNFLIAVCLAVVAAGCGRRDNTVEDAGPEALYTRGKDAMDASNFAGATQYFMALESRYPFSPETRQAQLDLIYVYYRSQQPESAIDAAEEFERENPTHPRVDYCLYMRGRVYFDQAPNVLERMFKVDLSVRPPKDTLRSFSTFQELIRRFPESEYVPDARQRMVFLRNRLAQYENHVADYYVERGAYVAAVNRAKYALEHYPGAPELERTLAIMIDAYERLGMQDLAADARRVLTETFGAQAAEATAQQR